MSAEHDDTQHRRGRWRDAARAWVEQTCEAQGVPAKVTDGSVIARVVTLLGKSEAGATAATPA